MEPYSLQPPSWRPLLHSASAALGVPDFFPPQAGAPELDISDVSAVRNGIAARSVVGNETFSAHEMIYDRLKSPNILAQLNGFMGEILKRREELARLGPSNNGDGGIDKPTHKLPSRVTPNDSKLAAYVRELADSQVSLSKLAKTVPHGFKGEKMLDMLYNGSVGSSTKLSSTPASATSNTGASATASVTTNASGRQEDQVSLPKSVPVDRALWFIQVVGATEMASHSQSQAHYHAHGAGGGLSTPGGSGIAGPTGGLGATHGAARVDRAAQVQLDFTNAVCSWLRRMLADLDVPASADAAIAESAAVLGGTEAASAGLSGSLLRRTFAGTQAPPPLSIRNNLGSASAPYPSPLLPASASTINLSRQANLSLSFTSTTGVPKAPFSAIAPSPSLSPNLDAVRIPMTPSRSAGGNSNFSFPGNPVPFSSPSTSNGPPPFTLHHQHTPPTSASASTRWAHKWSYALSLLRGLVTLPSDATPDAPGSLLQLPSWLRFLAELLGSANVAQIPFVLAIVLEFGIGWPPAEGGNASGGMTKGTLIARIGIEGALKARREVLALRHALLASLVADPIAETDGAEKGDGVVDADIGIQGDGDVSATVGASEPGTKTAAQDEMDVSVRRCDDLLIALISLARHLARGCDQALISPRLWSTYSSDLRAVLGEATFYADLQQRNSVLMLRHLSADGPRENWFDQQAADIEILDSIDLSTHWQTTWVQYFTRTSSQPASRADGRRTVRTLRDKVELLFLWACTSHRSSVGPSRPYIVGVFLSGLLGCNFRPTKHLIDSARKRWDGDGDVTSLLKERAEFAKLKAHATQLEESKAIDFHSFCIQFIADVESYCNTGTTGVEASDATETLRRENFASVSFDALIALIEELSNLGYFSMRKLLRKMTNVSTAAGSLPANTSGQPTLPNNSFQTRLLRSLPFPTGTQNLTNLLVTRRALIYGNRAGETWEEATERRATREVRALFSGLFQTDHAPFDMHGRQTSSISDFADEGIDQQLITTLPHLWSSPPFVQRRITRSVLLPAIEAAEASASISFTDTCLLLALLRKSEDFRLLNQVIMTLLRPGRLTGEEHGPIADKVSDAIICHAEVWKALDSLHVMVEQEWKP
ncbi:hypothetical protein K437DRAFT_152125 [Tilletiaria anomala UBC 951]|uniref:Mediator of RNA polymerase II transcription subunit 12 n=1 Tax=Tilletiaria anomala (strain ATCC 24038 / CBS 436.72 / UBC 951) TaxID=1037660 RepID=A0A066VT17_TILAU|nr:uncharacterized protein K437DRAFT_152125 [Tilletiaria anomala UBC 951]KDN43408.1 hypothetical protein K437DRAFT_152125 [Tilletiaria anomala UBC 951]